MGVICCAGLFANAQQPDVSGELTGSVTGHVIAQDTARPARFATVMLQPAASIGDSDGGPGNTVTTRTDAEGNFVAGNVAPGDYYVTANAPGYVSERAVLQAAATAGADPAALLAQLPVVHVSAGGATPATVTIERGGSLAGKAQWEDGSPASGVSVTAVSAAGTQAGGTAFGGRFGDGIPLPGVLHGIQSAGGNTLTASTDDRGAFRITGLPAGDYLLRIAIQPPPTGGGDRNARFGSPIRLYAPGVFRRADAKAVSIKAGEERSDIRIALDLRALRTVSGHVSSASAGQTIAFGRVTLVDPSATDLQLVGPIGSNGDFTVRYVPAGNYTLSVAGASTQMPSRGRTSGESRGVSFQPSSQPVAVADTDLSGVAVMLTPVASQP